MKALRTANKVSLLALRCSLNGNAATALLAKYIGQPLTGPCISQAPTCAQQLIRSFASGSDTQQHAAQGATSAPPIANTAADDSAKASRHVSSIDPKAAAERRDAKRQQAQQSLATTAPLTAAAIPAEEQPQQPEAAAHQEATLTSLAADSAVPTVGKSERDRLVMRLNKKRRQEQLSQAKAAARADAKREQPVEQQANDLVAAAAATAAASGPQASTASGEKAPASSDQQASVTAGQQASAASNQQQASATSDQTADTLPGQQQQNLAAQPTKRPPKEGLFLGSTGVWVQPKGTRPAPRKKGKNAPAVAPAVAPASAPPPAEIKAVHKAKPEKKLTEAQKEEQRGQIVRGILYSDKAAADLTEDNVNQYCPLNVQSIPEAFPDFYKGSLTEDGGCKGLQEELTYTSTDRFLYRSCIHTLHQKAAAQKKKRLYLDGPAGCGKSIAMASLVSWARSQGWLVMYVPRAADLIEGGTFIKAQDGVWDTPEVARLLLKSMKASHEKQLSELRCQGGETLIKLVQDGLNASQPGVVTQAAANLVFEMANLQTPVLIAVDGYNILYSHTNYYEWMSEVHRRQIQPDELRLASALRILEQQGPKQGVFVGAASHGGPVSPRLQPPRPSNSLHTIPKLRLMEAAQQLCHYSAQGLSEEPPELHAFEYAYFMTGGSARDLRHHRRTLMANQPSAVNLADLDDRYQYTLADMGQQQSQ